MLADLSLATRLTMITLIPTVAFMTVGGPAIGSALFAYGHFGDVDAGYLGVAIALSAFTLLPYAVVLLQLRVFYARQQPWIPIAIIVIITIVKIAASLLAPHITDNPDLVAGYLGLANGLGFLAGAIAGYYLLRNALRPPGSHLLGVAVVRTILVTVTASLLAGLIAHVVDELMGMQRLTAYGGGAGSLLRLLVLAVIMLPILATVMLRAQVPEAQAALAAFRGWIGARATGGKAAPPARRVPPASAAPRASGRSTNVAARKPGAGDRLLRSRRCASAGFITGSAPLFERLVLGNSNTLRGWNKDELDPLGGNRMVHNSVEYRYGAFQIFYDAGAIWEGGQPAVARASIGTGIREGPFSLAVAFPIRDGHTDPVFMVGMNY